MRVTYIKNPALLFLLLTTQATSQHVLRGRVIDAATRAPLGSANVFIAGTTRGTSTDSLGRYLLTAIPRGSYDVVASLVGYQFASLAARFGAAETVVLDFALRARILLAEEVQSTGTHHEDWQENLKRFRSQFLGKDELAEACTLLNGGVVEFDRNEETGVLTAQSDSVILIDNRALGYRLQVFLQEFRWDEREGGLFCRQYVLLIPLPPADPMERVRWDENRSRVYRGSRPHFLQSLFAGRSLEEGFRVYAGTPEELANGHGLFQSPEATEFLQHQGPDLARLSFPGYVRVDYRHGDLAGSSIITLQWGDILFDPNGVVMDPKFITVLDRSAWAHERLSRLLPIDYRPAGIHGR